MSELETIEDALPRERVWLRGVASASDDELLALILGTGTRDSPVQDLARHVIAHSGGFLALSRASPRELAQVLGIGLARATRIVAAFELGRRGVELKAYRAPMRCAEDIFQLVSPRLSGLQQEVFIAVGIDCRQGILDVVEVARGSLFGVEVLPREVFRPLIRMAAAAGVLVHNHPSGDPTPSDEDIALTHRLRDAGDLVGIPIIDHVICSARGFRSLAHELEPTS